MSWDDDPARFETVEPDDDNVYEVDDIIRRMIREARGECE